MSVASFQYEALTADGEVRQGLTKAENWHDAYRQLASAGLSPITISPEKKRRFGRRKKRISLRDLSLFTYQFSVLMEARLPISEGLRSIAEEETHESLKEMVLDIASHIEAGSTVTDSLKPYEHVFGDVYLETIHAAEQSGNMVAVLEHLSKMLDQEVERRASIRSALIYPLCVVSALLLAVVFLMIFIVPRFTKMFTERDVALPLPTKLLIGTSQFMISYWWLGLILVIGCAMLLKQILSMPQGRALVDRYLFRIPVVSRALQAAALARFAHVFSLSLSSGLSLIDCLEMSGRASGRPLLMRDANYLAAQVAQGGRLADALPRCEYITRFARRLISAGEQSAEMPRMCGIIARHYDREVRYLTKNVATIIEPILVLVLACVVLFIALAVFLPMWNMMSIMG
ncbi:MAG: type II secretion system F family protein [Planctomycetes bacterium]|nr:type II secretion system F family protein [Planctomycetota bacterium]NOG54674.1 type II secretion system F family protein [Planctomycetota bacterium]